MVRFQVYLLPCNGVYPDLVFLINGIKYNIPQSVYIQPVRFSTRHTMSNMIIFSIHRIMSPVMYKYIITVSM